jgi:hypothetical protein
MNLNLPAADRPTGVPGMILFSYLGQFWKKIFKDSGIIKSVFKGSGEGVAQFYLNYLEWVISVSVTDIPVFHREMWVPIFLKKSEKNTGLGAILLYGEDAEYGPQPYGSQYLPGAEFTYGGFARYNNIYSYPHTSPAVQFQGFICDTPINPSLIQTYGKDFTVRDSTIFFYQDPFDNPAVAKRQILDAAGNPVDEEALLWFSNGLLDYDEVYRNFGAYFQIKIPSSDFYQQLMEKLWFACVNGPSFSVMEAFLAAMGGIPSVIDDTETVQVIDNNSETGELQIMTDRNVYTYPAASNPVVAVGDTVYRGQILTDGIQVLDYSKDKKWWSGESALVLGNALLDISEFQSELVVKNEYVPVTLAGMEGSHYLAEFKVYGSAADVAKFWANVHARELSTDTYLSDLLGVPPAQVINPMDFFFQNIFSNNSCLIRIRTAGIYSTGYFNLMYNWFRKLTPAHVNIFLFIELDADSEPYLLASDLDPIDPYGADDEDKDIYGDPQNIIRAASTDLIESSVNLYTGSTAELTYREGTVNVRQIPSCVS